MKLKIDGAKALSIGATVLGVVGALLSSKVDSNNRKAMKSEIKEELMKHIVKLTKTNAQSKDDWYGVNTLADGTKAFHYMYIG